ncbi:hypothetical protein Q0Z83_046320 [Actinoplanes sichuanensis]|uniref:Uncharacterized protein n=1 Tax=Actinoplanes sichuanensis TaxID=512349 RepID=A0ABW4AB84_9ACTN|nr:hypothetical protein [Actinoplanes sichuanensis]BEL06441.1 hypothetical protein Q0Z83_046320 [Actinoplanes sichuanensis]
MTYDLYFWPAGSTDEPGPLADRLAEEDATGLAADERVSAFRSELLRRWPDLADTIAPWHDDLEWRRPWGRKDLADRFVVLTLPYRWKDTAALPVIADAHGLDCYDPQADELLRGRSGSGDTSAVAGWVFEDNVVRLMRQVSTYIGYSYDDHDEAALTGALDETDDESPDRWFEYPLSGEPELTMHLAQSSGGAVVSVRVEGPMDIVPATRIETLLDVL